MELNNIQIKHQLENDEYSKKHFLGVFPRDRLPEINKFPSSLVFNTDPSTLPGAHWIAMYIDEYQKCTFFDSFGFKPDFFGLESYLNRISSNVEYNSKRLQGSNSSTCGHYCIFFILLKSRNFSLETILDMFSKSNFKLNDFLIRNV